MSVAGGPLDPRYVALDLLPAQLHRPAVECTHGALRARLAAMHALRTALLRGALPRAESLEWPDPAVREPILAAIRDAGLLQHCAGDAELTDRVLLDVLELADDCEDAIRYAMRELAARMAPRDPGNVRRLRQRRAGGT